MGLKRVGILTGGGDCSGLNAVIRAVTRTAIIQYGAEVLGLENGFDGLIFGRTMRLTTGNTKDILTMGGTILGTTNKGNPFAYREFDEEGHIKISDLSDQAMDTFRMLGLDCLFVVGGEGTLELAHKFELMGMPVVGIPKTIDNDLEGTDYTFGFQTAVQVACDAMDRLHTTGRSHDRVMILEVMGRNAGWIALESGLSGGAHIILIPEIPYNLDNVVTKIQHRIRGKSPFSIIMVAEGAREEGGERITQGSATNRLQGVEQLGGIGFHLANRFASAFRLRCVRRCLATSSAAVRPRPLTGCWARAWALRPWTRRRGESSGPWWPSKLRTSCWFPSRSWRDCAAPCLWTISSSVRPRPRA
ncbi:MAG: ATP-dependent 6-phosphofructokinase [Desulfomicrobium sp.]|nr:ATP-dependent 6-phosphofructokinase [Desulfomicrobium sp.]